MILFYASNSIWKRFYAMNPDKVSGDHGWCLPVADLEELLPQLKVIFITNSTKYVAHFLHMLK
jgi:hypothetical protein